MKLGRKQLSLFLAGLVTIGASQAIPMASAATHGGYQIPPQPVAPKEAAGNPQNAPVSIAPSNPQAAAAPVPVIPPMMTQPRPGEGQPPSAAELAIVKQPPQTVVGAVGANAAPQRENIAVEPMKKLVVKKDKNKEDFDSILMTARTALSRGRAVAALELFNELYAKRPHDKHVLMGRAVALQQTGQVAEAVAAYEEVLKYDPKNLEALTNMLGVFKNEDMRSAAQKLQQLREAYPYNADVAAQLGMVYGSSGDYQNALKYLDIADALKPGMPEVLYNRAVAFDRMGNVQQASDLYRELISMDEAGALGQNFPIGAVKKRLATLF